MSEITFQFYFSLYSDAEYNFETLNAILKVEPTKTWQIDTLSSKKLYNETSGWQFSSGEIESYIFSEVFELFYESFLAEVREIRNVIVLDKLTCSLDVVIKIHSGITMPGISVSKDIMKKLILIGCDIDFDIYDYRVVSKI